MHAGTLDHEETHPSGDTWGPSLWLQSQGLGTRYLHAFNWGAGMILAYVPSDVVPQVRVCVTVLCVCVWLLV